MNKASRILLVLLVITGLVLALGGCQPAEPEPTEPPAEEEEAAPEEEEAPEAEEEVFKLGFLGPFSGPSARTGEEFKASATMALEEIDNQIGHYKIEPVWVDSQSDPAKASQAYEQAVVQDGIQAGVLNWHSSVAVSVMEVTAKHQVPHFFGFGATEVVNETFNADPEKYGYWMNKGWPTPKKLSASYVQALENAFETGILEGEKTAAIYGEDTDWGRSFGNAIKGQLEDAGWEILAEEYFSLEQTDFVPLLNKFVDLNPAVIAGTSTAAPSISAFIKQADEVGLESLIIADGLGWVGEWYDLTGESSNYVIDQIPGWATDEGKAYAEEFEARFGIKPSPSSGGLSYDGTKFFLAVAQAAYDEYGELSSEVIYNFVRDNVWTGEWTFTDGIVMNEYKYTEETVPDPVVGKGYYIFPVLQYFDGEGKVVFPPEWAEQDLTPKGAAPEAAEAEEPMEATETFKLGLLGPYSGPSAQTGKQFKGGATIALESVDYQVGPYKIEPVWIDSQSDPAKASQAYEQAVVQDGIQAGALNWHSSVAVSVMEVTAKHQVPHIFGFGATEVVNETFASDPDKYGYWMLKGWPTPGKLGNKYVDALEYYIEQGVWEPEEKTVAIYGEDTDWGRSFGTDTGKLFEEAGWEIVAEEYFALEQTDFVPLLNKFKDLNPAVIAGTSTAPPSITAFIKQADEVGLESLIIADGLGWVDFCSLTGSSANGVMDQIAGWSGEEGFAFAEEFEERYDLSPSTSSAGLSHDGTKMFLEIAQATYDEYGELTSENIYNFVKDNVWTGEWTFTDGIVMVEYKYTDETTPDPVVGPGFYTFPVLQYSYEDGKCLGKPIFPVEGAVQDLQVP